eukprot:2220299-Pyramimonas_sp.AAC.1
MACRDRSAAMYLRRADWAIVPYPAQAWERVNTELPSSGQLEPLGAEAEASQKSLNQKLAQARYE